jgi:hypothetical protein
VLVLVVFLLGLLEVGRIDFAGLCVIDSFLLLCGRHRCLLVENIVPVQMLVFHRGIVKELLSFMTFSIDGGEGLE